MKLGTLRFSRQHRDLVEQARRKAAARRQWLAVGLARDLPVKADVTSELFLVPAGTTIIGTSLRDYGNRFEVLFQGPKPPVSLDQRFTVGPSPYRC